MKKKEEDVLERRKRRRPVVLKGYFTQASNVVCNDLH
jgi:hypothetical protein